MNSVLFFLIIFICSISFAQSPIPEGAIIEKLRTGFLQPEGPIWKDGVGLLFSDIRANRIYCWSPIDSSLTTYLYPSDSSNGLTYDQQGRLILTQMAKRRVSRQETNGSITVLTSTYNGKKYNSPNDLVVKSDGSIFFTDPDFNTPKGQTKEMGFKGVFRISPFGAVYALDSTTFDKPNGICFSPDEKRLYVNESPKRIIYVWDVINDSLLSNKRVLYTIPGIDYQNYADGMKVDELGNIYCTGPGGIWIISPSGSYIDKIVMSETPSNCAWGNADRKTLYVTAGASLYRIRLSTTGIIRDQGQNLPLDFKLYQNYPNPFNPTTNLEYRISNSGFVTLKIYDTLGREISTLVNEEKPAGAYNAIWNADGYASGLYFCKLSFFNKRTREPTLTQTMKMLLIR